MTRERGGPSGCESGTSCFVASESAFQTAEQRAQTVSQQNTKQEVTLVEPEGDILSYDFSLSLPGFSTLMWVASYGEIEFARLLLDNGADVNHKTRTGTTALRQAGISSNI